MVHPSHRCRSDALKEEVSYRWRVDEPGFAMPVKVGTPGNWQIVRATTEWQAMKTSIPPADFAAATDLYFIDVDKH